MADELLRQEREASEKFRKETAAVEAAHIQAMREIEAKVTAEATAKAAAKKKATATRDRDKLLGLADRLQAEWLPDMTTEEGRAVLAQVQVLLGKVDAFIKTKVATL